ncbi:hypothetical protein SOVF_170340 [Spinacia oleracea]|nr:hypothetical protein SOVF_170340 [Spinacia oleracea]
MEHKGKWKSPHSHYLSIEPLFQGKETGLGATATSTLLHIPIHSLSVVCIHCFSTYPAYLSVLQYFLLHVSLGKYPPFLSHSRAIFLDSHLHISFAYKCSLSE